MLKRGPSFIGKNACGLRVRSTCILSDGLVINGIQHIVFYMCKFKEGSLRDD